MTSRQFYISLFVMTLSIKVQKLPSLISETLGKDTYLLALCYMAINLLGICLAFFILKKTKNVSFAKKSKTLTIEILKKLLLTGMAVYFLSQCLILYESIQNLFAHVLFYELPWTLFSLMLAGAVFFLAHSGIKNISLGFELYAVLIVISYIVIAIFGGTKADFLTIMPFETIDFKAVADGLVNFNLWFGDFFLVLFLGREAKHIKLKWTALVYVVTMLFVTLLYVEFFGIYQDYTPMKPSLISVLSEQSMLGVNIGRIDWFFILFTEIGTIISAGACLYFAKRCLCLVLPKAKEVWVLVFLIILIYFVDIFYLVDVHTQKQLFIDVMKYVGLAVKIGAIVILLAFCLFKKTKEKGRNNQPNIQVANAKMAIKFMKKLKQNRSKEKSKQTSGKQKLENFGGDK